MPGAKVEAVGVVVAVPTRPQALDGRDAGRRRRGRRRGAAAARSSASTCKTLKVAIDLNAVPPVGIEGVELTDKGADRDGVICYGAIGVGGTKMKIHKAAVAQLFEANNAVLDIEEIYELAVTTAVDTVTTLDRSEPIWHHPPPNLHPGA